MFTELPLESIAPPGMGLEMKKSILAFAILIPVAASAADMPIKAIPAVVPQTFGWTGCYVGLNVGYGWNDGKSSYRDANATSDVLNGLPSVQSPPPQTNGIVPTPSNTKGSGWIGGGQVGCNWQMAPRGVVIGFEADIDALGVSGRASTVGPTASGSPTGVPYPSAYQVGEGASLGLGTTATATEQVSLRWLSTIRARAGLPVLSDRGLLFLTGGLAIAQVSSSGTVTISQADSGLGLGGTTVAWTGSSTSTRVGYAVGGGLEYALTDHWTVKGDYLYYDVGQVSHPLNLNVIANGTGVNRPNLFYPSLGSTVASVNGSIIRLGLNYRFNSGPVVARY